jgi:PAP2 superfamily
MGGGNFAEDQVNACRHEIYLRKILALYYGRFNSYVCQEMVTFRKIIVLLIILCSGPVARGQGQDSLRTKKLLYSSIFPTTTIVAGMLITNSMFEQDLQETLQGWVGPDFNSKIDEYFPYIPIAEMYLADIMGVKSKNHWFDQTKYLLISNMFSAGIKQGLKSWTKKSRPNGESKSFPSGHTTFAFTNATVLLNEFNASAPFLAYSGFAFAATTGAFRMMNNEHWLSDVLVGAGIGILVTELVYYIEPFKAFNPFKKSASITFIPRVSENAYGFFFSYTIQDRSIKSIE